MKTLLAATLIASCTVLTAHAADPATVNGKPIKQTMVELIIQDAKARGVEIDDNARANILEKLISTELLDQEAQKSGIDKKPEFLVKEELARREMRINAFIEDYVSKNPIEEQALQQEYDRLKAHAQMTAKELRASHILVKSESEAMDVIAQLGKGADFSALAKEKSLDTGARENGGDIGWFKPESLVKPFADAAAKLEKGRYTPTPVQTQYGWHVIRLDDVRETPPPAFDSVKNEIRNSLQGQQLDKLVNNLREKARIIKN